MIFENAWWAREDSNLQPSGYERATFAGIINKSWRFRVGPVTSVRVWLRRSIGYSLVGGDAIAHARGSMKSRFRRVRDGLHAWAPGFEPGDGGIKIKQFPIVHQWAFRKTAKMRPQSIQRLIRYFGIAGQAIL